MNKLDTKIFMNKKSDVALLRLGVDLQMTAVLAFVHTSAKSWTGELQSFKDCVFKIPVLKMAKLWASLSLTVSH